MTGAAFVSDGCVLVYDGSLTISFQRYPESDIRAPAEPLPRSYGALPVKLASSQVAYLPVREGEAIWVGLVPRESQQYQVEIGWLETDGATGPGAWSALLSSFQGLTGVDARGEFRPFIRFPCSGEFAACGGVAMSVRGSERVEVRFVSCAEFESRTGRPAPRPMSPDDRYGGWRLP